MMVRYGRHYLIVLPHDKVLHEYTMHLLIDTQYERSALKEDSLSKEQPSNYPRLM